MLPPHNVIVEDHPELDPQALAMLPEVKSSISPSQKRVIIHAGVTL